MARSSHVGIHLTLDSEDAPKTRYRCHFTAILVDFGFTSQSITFTRVGSCRREETSCPGWTYRWLPMARSPNLLYTSQPQPLSPETHPASVFLNFSTTISKTFLA